MSEVDKQKHITNATERKKHTGGILRDLKKVLDDQTLLLSKWDRYGIRTLAYHWLIQYLDDRYQYAHINNTDSGLFKGNLWGATGFTSWTTIVYIT